MKATLEFNLPDEEAEHRRALEGTDWSLVVFEVLSHIREKLKYGEPPALVVPIYEEIRQLIIDEASDRNLSLE